MTSSAAVVNCPLVGGAVFEIASAAGASQASPAMISITSGTSLSSVSTPSDRIACLMPATLTQVSAARISVSSATRTQPLPAAGHR